MGNIQASTALYQGLPERIEIFGTNGSAILEAGHIVAWNVSNKTVKDIKKNSERTSGSSNPMSIKHHLHKTQINDFVKGIVHDDLPLVSGENAMRPLEVILKIYESSRKGKELKI